MQDTIQDVNEGLIEDGVFEEIATASTALVPVIPAVYRKPTIAVTRSDANFVAQLIATSERVPQTRELRRGEPVDALIAYAACADRGGSAGLLTRQTV